MGLGYIKYKLFNLVKAIYTSKWFTIGFAFWYGTNEVVIDMFLLNSTLVTIIKQGECTMLVVTMNFDINDILQGMIIVYLGL